MPPKISIAKAVRIIRDSVYFNTELMDAQLEVTIDSVMECFKIYSAMGDFDIPYSAAETENVLIHAVHDQLEVFVLLGLPDIATNDKFFNTSKNKYGI